MSGNQPMIYDNNHMVYSLDIYYYYYCYNYSITSNPQTALWFPFPLSVKRSTRWIQLHII